MENIHGGDVYTDLVYYDFSVNVNPLGMPLGSIRAAHEGIALASRYPDVEARKLRQKIEQTCKVPYDLIVTGNGAAELIYAMCYAISPKNAYTVAPTFFEYERAVIASGGRMNYYNLRSEASFKAGEGFMEYLDMRLASKDMVFLCNPNNPTGNVETGEYIRLMVELCKKHDSYLCIDECFLPFLEDEQNITARKYLEKYSKLIILNAFTKVYAMAGLRLGYAFVGDACLCTKMRECMQPWNTSIPAQLAGIAALDDREYLDKTRTRLVIEKQWLSLQLMGASLVHRTYSSDANFLLIEGDDRLGEMLLAQGILIRDCSNMPNLKKGFYRIAVRSHSENMELIRAIKGLEE